MDAPTILGEVSASKVAAVFPDADAAGRAAARVRDAVGLAAGQVRVLGPGDRRPGRKLEPESHGIFRTMLRAHAWLGMAGLAAGAVLFGVLWASGVPLVADSPGMAAMAILLLSGFGGLMLGGLVTLRPDHDPYILSVLEAIGEGRGAVVVHPRDRAQYDQAVQSLLGDGGDVVGSLAPPRDDDGTGPTPTVPGAP